MNSDHNVLPENISIRITCKKCGNSQIYEPRTIPKRPKTQCKECNSWIYISKKRLTKPFGQSDDDQVGHNDQKKNKDTKTQSGNRERKIHKERSSDRDDKIGHDRPKIMTKRIPRREREQIDYTNGMIKELQEFGKVIPLSEKQKIVNFIYENKADLIDAVDTFLKAYKNYNYDKVKRQKKRMLKIKNVLEGL